MSTNGLDSLLGTCNRRCTFLHHNHLSADWLYHSWESGPKFSNRTVFITASLVAQLVKNLPAVQETPVRFLGREDLLEKGKATHSSILAWRIP